MKNYDNVTPNSMLYLKPPCLCKVGIVYCLYTGYESVIGKEVRSVRGD